MSTALTILKKLESINVKDAAAKSILGTEEKYGELLKDQLLHGKGSDGEDLKPGYLEDPYFKSRESAERYLKWKERISPNVGRNPNAPNLYITGVYHDSLSVKTNYDGVQISSSAPFSFNIEQKYGGKESILGGEFRKEYVFKTVRPEFVKQIKAFLK